MDELLAEGDGELLELRRLGRTAEPGHGDEEVEDPAWSLPASIQAA